MFTVNKLSQHVCEAVYSVGGIAGLVGQSLDSVICTVNVRHSIYQVKASRHLFIIADAGSLSGFAWLGLCLGVNYASDRSRS